jgi:predicted outer membrane repeat protein
MKRKISLVLIFSVITAVMLAALTPVNAASSVGSEEALIKAITAGNDVKLTKSIELTGTVTIPAGKSVVLDLGGKTLDRALKSVSENGSVITVEKGASLTVTDSTGNPGVITGGYALYGGGICNYGNLKIENGVIAANKALDGQKGAGGGIYNGDGATLTLTGGTIKDNRAINGGGIYNDNGALVTVQNGSYKKKVGSIVVTVKTSPAITGNKATESGGGIYNASDLILKDSPVFSDNGYDIFLTEDKKITFSGALSVKDRITVMATGTDPMITLDFKNSGAAFPGEILRSASDDGIIVPGIEGEAIFKNGTTTAVFTYSDNKLLSAEYYSRVKDAWDTASNYAKAGKKTEMILGSDFTEDEVLTVEENADLTLDLNGHYIKRNRNYDQIKNGEVFRVKEGATFIVKDSNPNRRCYDGLRGGVITGGASTNSAGGIHLEGSSTLYMYGGTIYECVTCEDGGAINASERHTKIYLKDCRIYFCQAIDSFDACMGGGIYASRFEVLSLENVSIEDCYSEDSGGAIYLRGEGEADVSFKNVLFCGNKAYDNGGAIYINSSYAHSFRADGCTFVGNIANEKGGAFYLNDSANSKPIILTDCVFRSNYASDNGAAIYADGNGLVLTSCTVTENTTGSEYSCGAVFVKKEKNISLGGLTVIKDNKSNNGIHHDLVLDREFDEYAKIYDAGLEAGSYIGFSLIYDSKNINQTYTPIRNVTEYQMKYFHAESGTLTFEKDGTLEAVIEYGSVFGEGSLTVMIVVLAVCASALAVILIVKAKRKTKGGQDNENKE